VLESIHLDFELTGDALDAAQLARVLDIAERHICPVWVMLSAGTKITHSITLR